MFQHTAARRRLGRLLLQRRVLRSFNTQPPEGGWKAQPAVQQVSTVSTHSRPKAAGMLAQLLQNQQQFQHTAARRRLEFPFTVMTANSLVSTHSRPKAAGKYFTSKNSSHRFQHTAARRRLAGQQTGRAAAVSVSTHSRPKAAGCPFIGWLRLD